jgi:hypothetical protein
MPTTITLARVHVGTLQLEHVLRLLKIMHGESYACMRHEVWIIVDRTTSHHKGSNRDYHS